jgi:ABC-type antimicrobial peptide transport system permease subunit
VVFESVSIALLGGIIGLGLAKLLAMALAKLLAIYGDPTNGILATIYLPVPAAATAFAITLLAGVLAGIGPAMSAMRVQVVEALRRT